MIHAKPSVSLCTGTSRPNRHNAYLNSGGSKTGMELVIFLMTIIVQCLGASLAFALQKIKETLRLSTKILTWQFRFRGTTKMKNIQKVSRKTDEDNLYDRVKAPLTSSVYYYIHLSPLPA